MRKFKRSLLALGLSTTLALSLAACSSNGGGVKQPRKRRLPQPPRKAGQRLRQRRKYLIPVMKADPE